ncbi:pep-cterm sorting domain-containing protein [Anaeramoeba ignava]|uniref:Pep-cterm sorting domain-containing protein n=1 Tax=Anaeramoeba ignava TaxID=1746090 RepID=A0A9Q0R5P4_ANAIG|nr:pep-cterm sorting domain-containing protein [Anaeramoeba ignava]
MENYLNLEKLSNDLKNLFQNENQNESYFDFEIICEQNQTSFKTHKSILSSRSYYFKSLFNSKMKEYQENKIILKDVSNSILSSILNYFYSGKIEINLENAIEILIFSSKYLIDELINVSSNFIKNNLQPETIFILDNFEQFIKTPFFLELEENHLNFILSNDEISANEFKIFQTIIKWGKHKSNINQEKELEKKEKEKLQDQISNVIDKIRFIDFSKQELKDILKEDLIPNQISQKLIQFQKLQQNDELNQFIEKENQNTLIFKSRIIFKSSIILKEKEHIHKLKKWINDNRFFSKMKKGFSAKRDGFDCKKWHSICDNKGKTLIIIKTNKNYIFGGFTSVGFTDDKSKWKKGNWSFSSGYIPDKNAFIFSLRNDKNDRKPQRFKIIQGQEEYSIYYSYFNHGPIFGLSESEGPDFLLSSSLKSGHTNLGSSFHLPKGIEFNSKEAKSYLAGSYNEWKVNELETYFI